MKPPGDIIKSLLAPFVKGTRFDGCEPCEKRRLAINNFWTRLTNRIKAILISWKN